jgi:hypothetical protein
MSINQPIAPGSYAVVDLEFLFDREAHSRFMVGEEDQSKSKVRWPFRHVVAASVMILRAVDESGSRRLEVEQFRTFGRPEQTEREIVQGVFTILSDHSAATVVTWGGEMTDLPVLRAAALTYGLRVSPQLHAKEIHYRQPPRRHLDLALAVKGNAEFVHMRELAMRTGIPAKIALKAYDVGMAAERARWSVVKEQAEADVITTALLLGRHLYATGAIDSSAWGTDSAIVMAIQRTHEHRGYAALFKAWIEGRSAATLNEACRDQLRLAA